MKSQHAQRHQNVRRTFNTIYKLDILFLYGAVEAGGQKTPQDCVKPCCRPCRSFQPRRINIKTSEQQSRRSIDLIVLGVYIKSFCFAFARVINFTCKFKSAFKGVTVGGCCHGAVDIDRSLFIQGFGQARCGQRAGVTSLKRAKC